MFVPFLYTYDDDEKRASIFTWNVVPSKFYSYCASCSVCVCVHEPSNVQTKQQQKNTKSTPFTSSDSLLWHRPFVQSFLLFRISFFRRLFVFLFLHHKTYVHKCELSHLSVDTSENATTEKNINFQSQRIMNDNELVVGVHSGVTA